MQYIGVAVLIENALNGKDWVMNDICDMCGSGIKEGKCYCGEWKRKEEMQDNPVLKALELFHDMKLLRISFIK